ncbi:MAG TPA: patatin-like phospholipase family protein [Steroidobacteraceae bacterium]|nr:patatin-like phospholipase family protein [Steroidobacteraceae bacterium]
MDAEDDRTQIDPRANPWAMLAALPLFSGLPKHVVDEAVTELEWLSLPGGTLLFEEGSPADAVYFVVSGCLGVYGRAGELIGRIAAGETVGEMGLIVSRPRRATVRTLRDSELATLSAGTFERVLLGHPQAILRLARLTVQRLDDRAEEQRRVMTPRTIAIVPQDEGLDLPRHAGELVRALSRFGRADLVGRERAASHSPQWFHERESRNDFVVYAADAGDTPWSRLCLRQADVVLMAARAPGEAATWASPRWLDGGMRRAELLLLHEGGFSNGALAPWRSAFPGMPHHHLRGPADYDRLARTLTGRAVGLVLSGGGARGFAHLGVVRALREHGVPVDIVGGSSMGAILAAGVASDWSDEELRLRFKRCFVDTNPLSDFTLPLVSLVSGRKVGMLLRQELGDIDIEDLPIPFFCVSSNLTTGRIAVHQEGPLWRWLRASVAIPGVLPPVFQGGEVFVDGGAMNNLPVDVMRAKGRGPVIGVDCGTDRAFTTDVDATETPSLWSLLGGRGPSRRPNILQILWRAGMVNSAGTTLERRLQSDLLITPPLESVELLDWQGFDRAIEIGYRDACERLAAGALEALAKAYAPSTLS